MEPPVIAWEDDLGRVLAQRFCAQAKDELLTGYWGSEDLEDAIELLEVRLTARQRELLWHALTSDPELSELAAEAAES